ncbi:MAG TPA: hypothetical protein VIZ63_18570 [Povalibacter sp.]
MAMPTPCVAACEALHEAAERRIAYLNQRMQKIRHPAECMQACLLLIEHLRQDVVQSDAVGITAEERFAVIAAKDHVIATARHM